MIPSPDADKRTIRASARGYPGRARKDVQYRSLDPDLTANTNTNLQVNTDFKRGELRTILEKVQERAHVPEDNPDVIALRDIVNDKIERLEEESSKVNEAC